MDHSVRPVPELIALVDELESVHDDFDVPHRIIAILGDANPSSWQKSLLDIVDREPREALLGFTAPPEIWALGTLSSGWAAPVDDGDDMQRGRAARPSGHPDACRMRMISVTTRTGLTVGRIAIADGRRHEHVSDEVDGELGIVAESVRRALGLPTAAPSFPVSELFASMWLAEVLDAARIRREAGDHLTWDDAAQLHWAMRVHTGIGHPRSASDLARAARDVGSITTWEVVKGLGERGWLPDLVEPRLAQWMDEGMLARWVISAFPPLDQLTDDVAMAVWPGVAREIRAAVAELVHTGEATAA